MAIPDGVLERPKRYEGVILWPYLDIANDGPRVTIGIGCGGSGILDAPTTRSFPGGRHLIRSRMMAGKRRVFGAALKATVALAAAKGDRTTAQLASPFSSTRAR
jgi:hypothetical protein